MKLSTATSSLTCYIQAGIDEKTTLQAMKDSGIEQIRYCLIVISTVPVLAMYAVVQKYFQKGVMVGSVKG